MAIEAINITAWGKALSQTLSDLYEQRATGELFITSKTSAPWRLYFYAGCLVYATGGNHAVRRWHRALRQHCYPSCSTQPCPGINEIGWELELLDHAIEQNQMTASQAKAILQTLAEEVVFSLMKQPKASSQWRADRLIETRLAFLPIEPILQTAIALQSDWESFGLDDLSRTVSTNFLPDLAPILRKPRQLEASVSPIIYHNLTRFLQGTHSLWDVSVAMQKPLPDILHALLPWIESGIIELQEISDLPLPVLQLEMTTFRPCSAAKALIACIDDSPLVGHTLSHILNPLGYEVLPIANPLQGITTLLQRKPDLIFLDLIMPNTNGYELCTFLRKTSVFEKTPIVILTDNDTIIDRLRSKMVGSSEFLAKPIQPEKTIRIIQKHLGHSHEFSTLKPAQVAIA
ncbi:response regulator [Pseudanabaenaceae cyanobacterium LEGE 13415]|nr:response regulator [Pseudanabaenaceae cyanobacterium LEGE 13415]